jgi:uncharacterized BrkB/YihY/UPF0761 family membrane protein
VDGTKSGQTTNPDAAASPEHASLDLDHPDQPDQADKDDKADKDGWIKRQRVRVEDRYQELRDRVVSRRDTSTPIGVAFDTFGRDAASGGSVFAAALAFRVFLFYVPFVFFAAFAFGLGAEAVNENPAELARRGGMGAVVARAVGNTADISTWARITAVALSGYATYAGARGVVKVLRIVHGLVWQVPVPRMRKSWRGAVLFILLTTVAIVLTTLVGAVRERLLLGAIFGMALYILVPFVMWLIVSWLLPHPDDIDLWHLVPGAVVFGIGAEALHVVTVIWIPHLVSSKSETYGAIGIALVLLFWAYLLGRVMTMSVVLNAALHTRRVSQLPGLPPAPRPVRNLIDRIMGRLLRRGSATSEGAGKA